MFSKLLVLLFLSPLTTLGLSMCTGGKSTTPTPVPTASVSYETAMKAVEELTKVTEEQGKLIEKALQNDTDILVMIKEMKEALDQIEKFRAQNPEIHGRLTENSTERLRFECVGHVQGVGQADLFKLGDRTLFCTQPGVPRPADGSVCFNVPGTKFWDCGTGQVLYECTYCGCATPTATPNNPSTATATATPNNPSTATATATPNNPSTATATATPNNPSTATWTPPTTQPTPYGTATCESTPTSRPCEDQSVNFWAKPGLPNDKFGTELKIPGKGHHVPLPNTTDWQKVQEEVRMCQVHVVNAHSVGDLITGKVLTGCVLAYRQGLSGNDDYRQVRYVALDGYGYHINTPLAGFGLQEGGSQGTDALLKARKPDGSYACRIPGDANRPNAQDIQLMELGLEGK